MGAKKNGKKGVSQNNGGKFYYSMNNHQLQRAGLRPGFIPPRKPSSAAPHSKR